jgi:hypothetical protein
MSDTQLLLRKITALRQRLEQAQGLVREAGAAVAGLNGEDGGGGQLALLRAHVAEGGEHNALLHGAVRQVAAAVGSTEEGPPLPAHLTARARRLLERGRDLLGQLRGLADFFGEAAEEGDDNRRSRPEDEPLARFYRDTALMAETALRTVLGFPDAASAQLRLCEGLEGFLGVIAQRLARLTAMVADRRREAERIATLADLLSGLFARQRLDVQPFVALGEELLAEASQGAALRFLYEPPTEPARFVACHSLTVAHVAARVVGHDPEWRGRPLEPVLAALVHDVGMLAVPAVLLSQPGPLDDEQRRQVETHVREGAVLAARLLTSGSWLADVTAAHHERLDGTGYPDGRRELQVPSLARLLAVCDVYAALAAPRPHRPARATRTALTDTLLLAEQGALDRTCAERLLHLSFYPVGSAVELADGAVGLVVATPSRELNLQAPARPVVAVLTDGRGRALPVPQHLDLAQCEGRSIVRTLSPAERRDVLGARYPELV